MGEGGDDAKRAILARRAKFVAAAMAGLAASGCGKEKADGIDPRACLKIAVPRGTDDVPPMVCLSPPPLPRDAGATVPSATASPLEPCLSVAMDPADAEAPRPCLSVRAPPPDAGAAPRKASPKPCLLVMPPPRDDEG